MHTQENELHQKMNHEKVQNSEMAASEHHNLLLFINSKNTLELGIKTSSCHLILYHTPLSATLF